MRAQSPLARAAGFTLIELMIVVVVAAILLSIAVPSYQSEIRKSRRTDAKTALLDLASREQRFFSVQNTFTPSFGNLSYAAAGTSPASVTVGSGYYSVAVTAPAGASPPTFTLTATPIAGTTQASDTQCATFTVDNTGKQSSTDASSNDSTATCWQ